MILPKKTIYILSREVFYFLSITYVFLNILEYFWPGSVLAYININLILLFWLIVGIFMLVSTEKYD